MLFDESNSIIILLRFHEPCQNCAQISTIAYSRSLPTLIELGARSLGISVLPVTFLSLVTMSPLQSRIIVQYCTENTHHSAHHSVDYNTGFDFPQRSCKVGSGFRTFCTIESEKQGHAAKE